MPNLQLPTHNFNCHTLQPAIRRLTAADPKAVSAVLKPGLASYSYSSQLPINTVNAQKSGQ